MWSVHLYKNVCVRPLVKVVWYIKFLPSVNRLLVQICLPKGVGQNGMIHYVPAKCVQITYTSMLTALARIEWFIKFLRSVIESFVQVCLPNSRGQNGIIIYDPAKCDQIIWTSLSAYEHWSEWNDTLSSFQLLSNHLHKYVVLKSTGQNGKID